MSTAMTNRERILAILDGKSPNRIPWIPRLQLWYNARLAEHNLPERFAGMTLREVEHAIGVGTPAREGRIFAVRYEGMEVAVVNEGRSTVTKYITPHGTAWRRVELAESLVGYADSGLDVEFPIKEERDYDIWEYVVEHTYYDPTPEAYRAYDASIGDDGLPLVDAGDCPFHNFLMSLAGYQQAFLELYDRPQRVERLLQVMTGCERERLWPVVAGSDARRTTSRLNAGTGSPQSRALPPRNSRWATSTIRASALQWTARSLQTGTRKVPKAQTRAPKSLLGSSI